MSVTHPLRTTSFGAVVADAHGNPMTGSRAAVTIYDDAVDRLLRFHPDVVALAGRLVEEHPEAPMAHALMAYLCLMSTDTADLADARACAAAMAELPMCSRERRHSVAIEAWARGDWEAAGRHLDDLLVQWPCDILALALGHQLDFFVGDQANLRDRVGRSLGALPPGHDHSGFVLGMHAFGLEETGHLDRALDAGTAAVEANRDDVWAIHAVAHVHEVRGDVDLGLGFMEQTRSGWAEGNLFNVHMWWHHALYLLEVGRTDDVLAEYDGHIHHAGSDGVPIEMLDASSLLWRLWLEGADTGDRFAALATAWSDREARGDWYVFNDVHEVMALVGAGRGALARQRLDDLAATIGAATPARTNDVMTARIGLPLARAMVAMGEDRPDDALADLLPIRRVLHRFGGSNAQRDVFQQTAIEAAIGAGQLELADSLVRERLSLRPSSVFGLRRQALVASRRAEGVGSSS